MEGGGRDTQQNPRTTKFKWLQFSLNGRRRVELIKMTTALFLSPALILLSPLAKHVQFMHHPQIQVWIITAYSVSTNCPYIFIFQQYSLSWVTGAKIGAPDLYSAARCKPATQDCMEKAEDSCIVFPDSSIAPASEKLLPIPAHFNNFLSGSLPSEWPDTHLVCIIFQVLSKPLCFPAWLPVLHSACLLEEES